jgi:hypothetical protein
VMNPQRRLSSASSLTVSLTLLLLVHFSILLWLHVHTSPSLWGVVTHQLKSPTYASCKVASCRIWHYLSHHPGVSIVYAGSALDLHARTDSDIGIFMGGLITTRWIGYSKKLQFLGTQLIKIIIYSWKFLLIISHGPIGSFPNATDTICTWYYDSIGPSRMMSKGDDFSVTSWTYISTSNEKKTHTYMTSLLEHIFCAWLFPPI